MEIEVINIENSKVIRLNKFLIEKYAIGDKMELIMEEDRIILKPIKHSRLGWEKAFAEMHENGDDVLLIDSVMKGEDWG